MTTSAARTGSTIGKYGLGIGWRGEIADIVADLPGLCLAEVVAESLPWQGTATALPSALVRLRDRGTALVPRGFQLSLGGAEPVEPARVRHLAHCAEMLRSPVVSEHIAFVRAGGLEAGDLLPVPRTRAAVDAIVDNVRLTQQELPVPLALAPIAALFDWPDDELDEADFLTKILDRTGALLLLDVAAIHANARRRGADPLALIRRLPLERVAYMYGPHIDIDASGVPDDVLDLVSAVCALHRPSALVLECAGGHPDADVLRAHLDAAADAAGLPRITNQPDDAP